MSAASSDPADTAPVDAAWFEAPVCRNCDAPLDAPYCPQCGQKRATRLVLHDVGKEGWERLRVFELQWAKTLKALLLSPGVVARDYVLGRRTRHMHPLKLLVALVAILVLILASDRYFAHYHFTGRNRDVDLMAERVMAYANWSFSIGIVAIFLGSWTVFRRRLGYNVVEHAVLSIYCQILILAVIILNLLPTLLWRSPDFILIHKAASKYYLYAIKLAIVGVAYAQFFRLHLRADWLKLIAACLVYLGTSWVLLRLYAMAILWLVTGSI